MNDAPFYKEEKNPMHKLKQIFTVKTIKRKLILYNLIIVISIALFVSIYNYISYRNATIDMLVETSEENTWTAAERLQVAYDEMLNIVLNCSERKSLFLSLTNTDYNTSSGKRFALYASQILNDYCAISGYSEYIAKITLYQKDGILVQSGYITGSYDDVPSISQSSWFQGEQDKNFNAYQLALVESPFHQASDDRLLPIIRTLKYDYDTQTASSWVMLGISTRLYQDSVDQINTDNPIYAITSEGDIIASANTRKELDGAAAIPALLKAASDSGSVKMVINGTDNYVSYTRTPQSGILIYEILPHDQLVIDHTIISKTIFLIFASCIAIGMGLSILISRKINQPIALLLRSIKTISGGDFSYNPKIEGADEIGTIGTCINQMSWQITNLLDTRIEVEKEKKDLEIKMLQAQINPHFLYNTLDSVRWMATIQKNTGIVKMITSLSSLLKNMAKGFNEKVTLEQELEFLDSYVTIQKIKYVELFDLDIQIKEPRLSRAKIVKLTLQPLVENAIFSGIEPSGHNGTIHIIAESEDDILYIHVIDNGIGIPSEKIDSLLAGIEPKTAGTMSGIGLPNVDRRLKLVYGDGFGLHISSQENLYTKITIKIPLEF